MKRAANSERSGGSIARQATNCCTTRMGKGYQHQDVNASMITHRNVVLSLFLLCPCCLAAQPQSGPTVPVLTLCEALRDLDLYRGKQVAVVARAGWTFEGTFLSGKCEADGRITIQGTSWLSMIAVDWNDPKAHQGAFPVDEVTIRRKLVALKTEYIDGEQDTSANRQPPDSQPRTINPNSHWVAVFGVLNSPPRLRPPRPGRGPSKRSIPGNGYGANGSVPANILISAEKALD
jgi:hypothetical protein